MKKHYIKKLEQKPFVRFQESFYKSWFTSAATQDHRKTGPPRNCTTPSRNRTAVQPHNNTVKPDTTSSSTMHIAITTVHRHYVGVLWSEAEGVGLDFDFTFRYHPHNYSSTVINPFSLFFISNNGNKKLNSIKNHTTTRIFKKMGKLGWREIDRFFVQIYKCWRIWFLLGLN